MNDTKPKRRSRLWLAFSTLGLIALIGGGLLAWQATRSEPTKTPCEAAAELITKIRGSDPIAVGYLSGNYDSMFRGMITGQYQDVEGDVPPELAARLRTVADDMGRLGGAGPEPDEFSTGPTGRHMDELLSTCR